MYCLNFLFWSLDSDTIGCSHCRLTLQSTDACMGVKMALAIIIMCIICFINYL